MRDMHRRPSAGMLAAVIATLSGGCESLQFKLDTNVKLHAPELVDAAKAIDPLAINRLFSAYVEEVNKNRQDAPKEGADILTPKSKPFVIIGATADLLECKLTIESDVLSGGPYILADGFFPRVAADESQTAGLRFNQIYITSPVTKEGTYTLRFEIKGENNIGYKVALGAHLDGAVRIICARDGITGSKNPSPILFYLEGDQAKKTVNDDEKKRNAETTFDTYINDFMKKINERASLHQERIRGKRSEVQGQIANAEVELQSIALKLNTHIDTYPFLEEKYEKFRISQFNEKNGRVDREINPPGEQYFLTQRQK